MSDPVPSFGEWLRGMRAEPVVITTRRYLCPHCRRGHWKPAAARKHIARCWKNPDAHGCKTCVFYRSFSSEESCEHAEGPGEMERPIIDCHLWKGPAE